MLRPLMLSTRSSPRGLPKSASSTICRLLSPISSSQSNEEALGCRIYSLIAPSRSVFVVNIRLGLFASKCLWSSGKLIVFAMIIDICRQSCLKLITLAMKIIHNIIQEGDPRCLRQRQWWDMALHNLHYCLTAESRSIFCCYHLSGPRSSFR